MKDYLDHFTVVWRGDEPLLPPRRSKPPRWWTMGGAIATVEQDPKDVERLKESMRPKRAYNRRATVQPPSEVNCRVGELLDGRIPEVRSGPALKASESAAEGDGTGGQPTEPLPTLTNNQTTTTTETDK